MRLSRQWPGSAICVRLWPRKESLVNDRFTCLAVEPSGVWVKGLVAKYSRMVLYALQNRVAWRDGSLNWSEVVGTSEVGLLSEPGLSQPLLSSTLAERRRRSRMVDAAGGLRQGDPLAAPAKASSKGRGRGGFALGRGRGFGRLGRPTPEAPTSPDAAGASVVAHEGSPLPTPADRTLPGGHSSEPAVLMQFPEEMDMCDIAAELDDLLEDDIEELVATYASDAPGLAADSEHQGLFVTEPEEASMPEGMREALEQEIQASGLGAEGTGASDDGSLQRTATSGPLAGSSTDPPPPPPPPPTEEVGQPPAPAADGGITSPSAMGAMGVRLPRSCGEIQRTTCRSSAANTPVALGCCRSAWLHRMRTCWLGAQRCPRRRRACYGRRQRHLANNMSNWQTVGSNDARSQRAPIANIFVATGQAMDEREYQPHAINHEQGTLRVKSVFFRLQTVRHIESPSLPPK